MKMDWRLPRAAKFGNLKEVKALIALEPELVNSIDEQEFTGLHWAARFDHRQIAEVLLTNGANVNARETHEITPLHISAAKNHSEMTILLLEYNADINAQDSKGATPLDYAAFANYEKDGIFASLPPVFFLLQKKGAQHGQK